MTRSLYKPEFITQDIYRKLNKIKQIQGAILKTRSRSTVITKKMIGSLVKVYTGIKFVKVNITTKAYVGHKLGEFAFTKRMGSYLHKKSAAERLYKKKQKVLAQKQSRNSNKKKTKIIKKAKKK